MKVMMALLLDHFVWLEDDLGCDDDDGTDRKSVV